MLSFEKKPAKVVLACLLSACVVASCMPLAGCGSTSTANASGVSVEISDSQECPSIESVELVAEEQTDDAIDGDLALTWNVTVSEVSGVTGYEVRYMRYNKVWQTVRSEDTTLSFVTYSRDMNLEIQVRSYIYSDGEFIYSDYSDSVYPSYTTYDDTDSWEWVFRMY